MRERVTMRLRNAYRILAATVCAGVATYLTVTSFGTRTPPPSPVAATPAPARAPDIKPNTKTVIVAAKRLQFGTVLTADALTEAEWPVASVPPGAFHSRESLLVPGALRTVLTVIAPNEPILASKISGPGQRGSLSAVIEDGMKAVTIRVDDVLGVAGFVQPGDRVDVLMTRNERTANASGKATTGLAYAEALLQNVRVLAVDQVVERTGQAKPAKAVTVEVTADGAAKVSLGMEIGRLSLVLLRAGSTGGPDYRRIEVEDLGRRKPGVRTAPDRVRTPPDTNAAPDATVVTVTRGTDRKTYEITESGRHELKVSSKAAPQPSGSPQPEQ
jgi:pilus assembly protein CpaB